MLSHPESAEREPAKTYPHNATLRRLLIEYRDQPHQSNNTISKALGVSSSVVSQYLNEDGCIYAGDVAKLERKIDDLLENNARRRASGVDTLQCRTTEQMSTALEYIRKTNDVGVVLENSGGGKTRAEEYFTLKYPTAIHYQATMWTKDVHDVESVMFDLVGKTNYDGRSKRALSTVRNMRGSDRLIIVGDAHKLTRPSLQWFFDFHDATLCPIALIGTFELLQKLEDDPQRLSRVGLRFEITDRDSKGNLITDKNLIKHMVESLMPNAKSDSRELLDLAEQVASQQGHYRAVHKQLKVATELMAGNEKLGYAEAFRVAHTMLLRNYNLN